MVQLTSSQRQTLERLLRENIARLRGEISTALQDNGALQNHMEELDDQAIADLETAIEIAGIGRDQAELRDHLLALDRLNGPDYGVCPDCRGTIAFQRLQANPAARRCVRCQEHAEQLRAARPASM